MGNAVARYTLCALACAMLLAGAPEAVQAAVAPTGPKTVAAVIRNEANQSRSCMLDTARTNQLMRADKDASFIFQAHTERAVVRYSTCC